MRQSWNCGTEENSFISQANCLDSIRVLSFKGLKDVTLEDMGNFNVILGKNDVGKTSVLEALFLVTGFTNLSLPVRVHNHRNFVVQSVDDFFNFFHRLDADTSIELIAKSKTLGEQRKLLISAPYSTATRSVAPQKVKHTTLASETQNGDTSISVKQLSTGFPKARSLHYEGTLRDSSNGFRKFVGEIEIHSTNEILTTPVSKEDLELVIPARIIMPGIGYDVSAVAELIVNKQDDVLLDLLRAINPEIQKIAVSGNTAYLDLGLERLVPLNMFGGGTVRTASILSHCILGQTRILLIDELENGFHHTAMCILLKSLLTLADRENVQIVTTSHSIETLRTLQNILQDEEFESHRASTVCYTLEMDLDGNVRPYRYNYSEFDHCIENEIEIR